MSYPLEALGSPFRRGMDTRTSYAYSRSSGGPSSGFRSQSWSRTSPGSTVTSTYKRSVNAPVSRSYGSAVLASADGGDYGHSSVLVGEFKRSSEKEQLQGLNDRFAVYIDKVHYLEQQNKQIETEIQSLRQKQVSRTQLGDLYDRELQELRATLEQIHHDKVQIQLDTDHIEEDIQRLRERFDEEARVREETEAIIRLLKKDTGDSELAKSELEKKVQSLQDEVAFIRNNHEEEVGDLLAQIQASQVTVERRDPQRADITEALREIRCELEGHSQQNQQQVENWFMCRYVKLTEAAEQNKDAIKSARDEISDYRRQLQSKTVELESVRGTRESLERQLMDVEDRHNGDLASMQETIHQLDNELKSTKWEMARHLREYQDLLNVKMALDIEIASYRKLLEGEETHFSTFPYRQSITTTKIVKPKSEAPRLKVQHKFVEEIIEETRVEDEKCEIDDALEEIAQELSATLGDGADEEEEEDEGEEEEAEGEVEEEQGEGKEEEIVAATQAKVSSSAPAKQDEEEDDGKGGSEEEEGEDDEKEGKEGDGKREDEDEEGGDAEGSDDAKEGAEEEEVEETILCSKAPASKASPDKEKAADIKGSRGEEGDDDKATKSGDDKEDKDKKEENLQDKKSEEVVAKTEAQKTEIAKPETQKEEDAVKEPSKPDSLKSESPKPGSPKAESPKSESPKPASPKSESPKDISLVAGSPKGASPKAGSPKGSPPKAGSPKPSSPKDEPPKLESLKLGSPKSTSPKAESPKAGSPKAESPKAGSPKAGSPKAGSPKAEPRKAGSPKAESPKGGSPKAGSPKAESPKAGSPKAGSPKAESPKAGSPKAGSPKAESPKAGSPKAGSPKAGSPKAESPKAGSPKAEAPKAESPKTETTKHDALKAVEEKTENKSDSKDDKKVENKDAAMNGNLDKSSQEEKKKDEKEDDVMANGVDESPVKDDGSQKVVITKTVETITTGEDGSKHVTKSVTVTETMKEVEEAPEVVQELLVATKKVEKHSIQTIKQVTEGD